MDSWRKVITSGRFKEVQVALPPHGRFTAPTGFRFTYPWPWQEVERAEIVDAAGGSSSAAVLGTLAAPRATGTARLTLWQEGRNFDGVWQSVARELCDSYQGTLVEQRHVRLAELRAVVVEMDVSDGRRISRLVAESPGGHLVQGEFTTPRQAAAGYRPHFDTMLASWRWS